MILKCVKLGKSYDSTLNTSVDLHANVILVVFYKRYLGIKTDFTAYRKEQLGASFRQLSLSKTCKARVYNRSVRSLAHLLVSVELIVGVVWWAEAIVDFL